MRVRRGAAAVLLVAGASLLAACGSGGTGSADNGKQIFSSKCSSCHTLADANAKGTIGPNLDDAFRASRQAGIPESTMRNLVTRWLSIAQMPMPRDLVTGQDALDVAAYVAKVAGTSAESTVRPAPAATGSTTAP